MTESGNHREWLLRAATSAVAIPAVLAIIYLGGWWFAGPVAIAAMVIYGEWLGIVGQRSPMLNLMSLAGGLGAVGVVATIVLAQFVGIYAAGLLVPLSGIVWMVIYVGAGARGAIPQHGADPHWIGRQNSSVIAAGGIIYAALPAVVLIQLRADPVWGLAAVVWLMLVVWATDIGAYMAGRAIGGPRIWPAISPNKTWAGLVGGMVSAGCVGWLAFYWVADSNPVILAVLAATLAVIAQIGDFAESALKRAFGVKDSGTLLPGHGGLMDRVDGLIAVLIAVMALVIFRGELRLAEGVMLW